MTTKEATPFIPTCEEYRSSTYYASRCGKVAIVVGVKYNGEITPLCAKHRGVENRRTYKNYSEMREPTAADLKVLKVRKDDEIKRDKVRAAEKAEQNRKQHEAYEARRTSEVARDWQIVREDVADYEFRTGKSFKRPSWKAVATDGSRGDIYVEIEHDGDRRVISARNASKMDPKEAATFVQMVTRALDELHAPEQAPLLPSCEICGKPIESGRLPVYSLTDMNEQTGWIHGDRDCQDE